MTIRRTLAVCIVVAGVLINTGKSVAFSIVGIGTTTCAKFAQEYKTDPNLMEAIYFSWAQGFMSGINAGRSVSIDLNPSWLKTDKQWYVILQYCNKNPLADYATAVIDLYLNQLNTKENKKGSMNR